VANPPPDNDDDRPTAVFRLEYCTVTFYRTWSWTQFPSGQGWGAVPHRTPSYRRLASKLGYRRNIIAYCLEHDFLHSFIEQELNDRPSPVIHALAHGQPAPRTTAYEEALVQMFQGFLRAGWDMTATQPGVDWWAIREKARSILGR
jgi:hypothetical protein